MKFCQRLVVLIISLCASSPLLQAELLIVKQTDKGFTPLDASDESKKDALAKILLSYEWPMVIANTALSSVEQDALLTAGKLNGEENFIRAKVKMVDASYDVIFIPTSMYELFCLYKYSEGGNPLKSAADEISMVSPDFEQALGQPKPKETPQSVYEQVFHAFIPSNKFFYNEAFFYINNELVTELFAMHLNQSLHDASNASSVSDRIQNQYSLIAAFFIDKSKNLEGYHTLKRRELDPQNPTMLTANGIVAKVISLEYEARASNKALLFRGTSPIEIDKGIEGETLNILGSQIKERSLTEIALHHKGNDASRKMLKPYSISFGNSLFAGYIYDREACAYHYLDQFGGYALLIDKKYYIKNLYAGPYKSLDLFFIAPLAPLAALFGMGEFFHSRTKAAVEPINRKVKPQLWRTIRPEGFNTDFIDPTGVVSTDRDPLVHAEVFSKYLAANMRIISKGSLSRLTAEEKKAYEDTLKRGQMQAGQYYKAIRVLESFAKKVTQKIKEKGAEKNSSLKNKEIT